MQAYRISSRIPQQKMACYAAYPRHASRGMSHFNPFFTRFAGNDLAPLMRLVDEVTGELTSNANSPFVRNTPLRTFQPRFDVRETNDAYQLTGELPGLDSKDLQLEFTDEHTLVVRGRTARESSQGDAPSASIEQPATAQPQAIAEQSAETPAVADAETASTHSDGSNYHKPTVEEEFVDVGAENTEATSSSAKGKEVERPADGRATKAEPAKTVATEQPKNKSRYWVSERSVGEFHRSFTFAGHVDQDAVTASLKNGILSVVVPKALRKEPKRIVIQ